jgi:plastocyanin
MCFDLDNSMRWTLKALSWLIFLGVCSNWADVRAQDGSATVDVVITQAGATNSKTAAGRAPDASKVAVWLTPLDRTAANTAGPSSTEKPPQLVQRRKTFEPHILIVHVGTVVEFPNKDPFFHNIFSLYDGRRFDLGLYEAGTTRSVQFDRPGVSFLFCNIHAEMSAVVVAVETPYFGLSDRSGHVIIPHIPDGRYQLNAWYERSLPENLKGLTKIVTLSGPARNLGLIRVLEDPHFTPAHKNKYGLDYIPPPNPEYEHP